MCGGCLLPGEKPFLCEADGCGRSFAEYSSLRKHMLVHSGESLQLFFRAERLFFFFSFFKQRCTAAATVYHTVISKCAQVLSITDVLFPGEKPHHCGICGKTFSQSGSRNVHMRKRHGEEGLSGEGKETGSSYPTRAALGGPVNPGIMSLGAAHAFENARRGGAALTFRNISCIN